MSAAAAGDQCQAVIPIHPESLPLHADDAAFVDRLAADELSKLCAKAGLTADNVHQIWCGTVKEARSSKYAAAVTALSLNCDHLVLYIYEATAA